MHHSEKPEPGIHAEDSSIPENGKEGDSIYVAANGGDKPSADTFNTPNLDSGKSVVLDGECTEEGTSSSGDMGGNNSFSERQQELANVPGQELLGNTMQEVPTEATQPSDPGSFLGAGL